MIDAYLNQTAMFYRKTGQDAYGKPTYDAGTAVKVRWQGHLKLVRDKTGKEVVAESQVWLRETVAIDDKLTYGERDYIVLSVSEEVRLDGTLSHRVVWV